jgi:hypothetical protein
MLEAMNPRNVVRIGLALAGLCITLPATADTQFRIARMTRDDVPIGKGQCDIRLQVDNEVEVAVRLDTVSIRTIAGRDAYDDKSECNAPLPDHEVRDFHFEVRDSRGDIRLIAEPSRRNNYSAVVLIRDTSGGQGRYHFRLTWAMAASDYRHETGGRGYNGRPGPPEFTWNNALSFRGKGNGAAPLNGFDRRLLDCKVEIDRGGKAIISFRTDRGGSLSFYGDVTGREGSRFRADVASEDRRLRGPMWISVDDRQQQVNSITLEATDGRDRLRLNWDRH